MNSDDTNRPLAAFSQIGHAFFAKDGVQLAFGRRWDGELIHISQADRGAACGCVCPANDCQRKLIARKPDKKIAHHFYHAPPTKAERMNGVAPNCRYAPMTILHEYAEKLLNERKTLVLPPLTARFGERSKTRRTAKPYSFDAAKLEKADGETVPDVILYKGEHRMHVEIYVTHRCSEEKRAKIIRAEIAAVEIDLSGVDPNATVEDVNKAILSSAPREWIYNRKVDDLLKELLDEVQAEEEAAKRRRQKALTDLAAAYSSAHLRAFASEWKDAEPVVQIGDAGDAILLNGGSGGEGYFSVHPKVWKAAVLGLLHERFGSSSPSAMVEEFGRRGWLVERFVDLEDEEGSLASEAGLPIGGPRQAIVRYLQYLARKGIASDEGWRWGYTVRHADVLHNRAREKQRLAREAAERSSRHSHLAALVQEILVAANSDTAANFDLSVWVGQPVGTSSQTPQAMADAGDAAWHELTKGLKTTLGVLKDEAEESAEDFGLPVSDALRAMRAVQEARAAQQKSEAEEKERQERQARLDAMVQEAKRKLGDESDTWLDKPFQRLDGLTPRKAAPESSAKLETARWILDQVLAARALKAKWTGELEREATALLRRVETDQDRLRAKVKLYMSASDPDLPNRVSPRAHTKNEATMQECLALLKQRIGKR